jgi:hypothetical protein
VKLSNNEAERAFQYAVVGRKKSLSCQSINGADTMAILYTIVETCKINDLHPKEYLSYLIAERWHGRTAKTLLKLVITKVRNSREAIFSDPNDWRT